MVTMKFESAYLEQLYRHQEYAEFKQCISKIFGEPLCINFVDIITKKVKQGLTMDNIVSFHNKYPNRSIFYLLGFLSEKGNNVHILLPT